MPARFLALVLKWRERKKDREGKEREGRRGEGGREGEREGEGGGERDTLRVTKRGLGTRERGLGSPPALF